MFWCQSTLCDELMNFERNYKKFAANKLVLLINNDE